MRLRWFFSGGVASKTTDDLLKVTGGGRGRVQNPPTFNIARSHLNHCIIYNSDTDIQMSSVQKTFHITLKDVFLTYSIRILRSFCDLKEQMPVPWCLSEVWEHPIAQGHTLLTTTATRCGARSSLRVCCWGSHWTKVEELLSQPFAFRSKQIHVPRCLNLSLSCVPGIGSFPLHHPVVLRLKVQSGFGGTLKLKRQDGVFSSLFCLIGRICIQKRDNCRKSLFPIDFNEARDMSSGSKVGWCLILVKGLLLFLEKMRSISECLKYLGHVFQVPGVVYSMCCGEAHILSLCDEGLESSI